MKQEVISSAKNPLIKRILGFEKKRNRDFHRKFVVEGIRENKMALANGWTHEEIILPEKQQGRWLEQSGLGQAGLHIQFISNALFEKIAYRGKVENVIGIYHARDTSLSVLTLPPDPLVLILEALEKPGNIGAIMRSADAAGVDAIIIADPVGDLYNPNLIRSSLGTVFSLPVATASNEEVFSFVKQNNLRICTSYLEGSKPHYEAEMIRGTCIVMGSEAKGVTTFWADKADELIRIPMLGQVDSMNVSTATAVMLYEAIRQRKYNDKNET